MIFLELKLLISFQIDSAITYASVIYIWIKQSAVLRDITSLVCSVEIVCLLPISTLASILLLKSKNTKYDQRLDAIGAWILMQFINLLGNIGLIASIVWSDGNVFFHSNFPLTALLWWKSAFVLIQVSSVIYSIYIVLNPLKFIEEEPRSIIGSNVYTYFTDRQSNSPNLSVSTPYHQQMPNNLNPSLGVPNHGYLKESMPHSTLF